jgi:hypothetical protein
MHNFSQIDSKYPISDTVNIIKGVYNKIPHIPFVKEDSEILRHIDKLIEENSKAAAIGIENLIKRYTIHSPGIIFKLKEFIYSIFNHDHKEKMWTKIIQAKFEPLFELFNKPTTEFKHEYNNHIQTFIDAGLSEDAAIVECRIFFIKQEIGKIFNLHDKIEIDKIEIDKIYNSFVSYMKLHKLNGISAEDIINIFKNYFHPHVKTLTFLDSNLINKAFDYVLIPHLIETLFSLSTVPTSHDPVTIEPNNIDIPQNTIINMPNSDVTGYSSTLPFAIGAGAAAAGLGAYAVYNKMKQKRNKFTPQ